MLAISFNIKSVREFNTRSGEKSLRELFDTGADAIFLQETHLLDEDVADCAVAKWAAAAGWKIAAFSNLSRISSGVMMLVPAASTLNATVPDLKKWPIFAGRVIECVVGDTVIINTYVVHSGMKLEKLVRRTDEWDVALRTRILEWKRKGKKIVVLGDMNVAPEAIDLANPKANARRAGFTKEERESWARTVADCGLIDTFRKYYPKKEGCYSFWTLRVPTARENNVGWRLDSVWTSAEMKTTDCGIMWDIMGSDHAPIYIRWETSDS